MPSATGLTGAAGEYYVAAELSRRDWLATVTIKNSPGTDVLAQRLDRSRVVAIQVKTASPRNNFQLKEKDENPGDQDNEWYVLVSLSDLLERPSFYVIPRHVLAALAYLEHREWVEGRGRLHGVPAPNVVRKLNPRRTIKLQWITGYLERWDLLEYSSREAPFVGEPRFLDLATTIPLPRGFPPLG